MSTRSYHAPASTRQRCPVCNQAVYSRAGIHPQCALKLSEPPLPPKAKPPRPAGHADGAARGPEPAGNKVAAIPPDTGSRSASG